MSSRVINPKDPNLSAYESSLEDEILSEYRVYADGTVQFMGEKPYSFMSDDYVIVRAIDEANAFEIWREYESNAWGNNHVTKS